MEEILLHNLKHAGMISMFVFVMMVIVDYINVLTRGRMGDTIQGGRGRQYFITTSLGVVPGCLGSFMNVSFYIKGLLTFGAMVGGMIATSGDEAFVMLTMFPIEAVILFSVLFVIGIFTAWISDKIADFFNIIPCKECKIPDLHELEEECRYLSFKEIFTQFKELPLVKFLFIILFGIFIYAFSTGFIGPQQWGWKRITFISLTFLFGIVILTAPKHYLEEHIWKHIAKKHIWKVFLWSFGALLIVNLGLKFWNLESFIKAHMFWVLLIATLIAIIPESGPHFVFVMMFAQGIVPFSVLLASSIVQDGHGLLPLLSYSVKDTFLIKLFNFCIGLSIGIILYSIGF